MAEILRKDAIKEIFKCGRDPVYFINNYCKTIHPMRGLVPLELYDYQERAIKNFVAHDNVIVNKARQLGFSTITAAFVTWLIYFHENKSVLVVATKADVAKNIIKKVKKILSCLPDWMYLSDVTINQAHQVGLGNGSWVKALGRSDDVGRSESLSLLVLDEAAHIRNMTEIWKSVGSTLATGGKCIALSTPNGIGGSGEWFYKYYSQAESKENDFFPMLINWWEHPEYSQGLEEDPNVPGGYTSPWFKKFTKGKTHQEISQELVTSFLESGDTFISAKKIQELEKKCLTPIEEGGIDKRLWIWKHPTAGRKYLISADTASGGAGGTDYCTAYVMDLVDCEMVAEYKGDLTPDVFADFLVHLAESYNNAFIVAENNGVGLSTNLTIKRIGYRNLGYFDQKSGNTLDKWTAEYKGINPGYRVDSANRPVILSKFQEFLNNDYIKIPSIRFTKELHTFIVNNAKPQASKGHNDDLIMAAALGIWIRDVCPEFNASSRGVDYGKLYGAASVGTKDMNGVHDSRDEEVRKLRERYKQEHENQTRIQMPTNMHSMRGFPLIIKK